MITLTPTTDEFPDLVRVLIDLANDVNHVQSTSDTPSLGLVIPEYLHRRYLQYMELGSSPLPARKKRSQK